MSKNELVYVTYDEITLRIDAMMDELKRENFSSIVVIVRGGLFPAHYLSIRTGLPIFYLCPERSTTLSSVSWIGGAPPVGKVLLVDDYSDSGTSLSDADGFLRQQHYEVNSFVIFQRDNARVVSDYCCVKVNNPWETLVLPWRRMNIKELSEEGSRSNSTNMSHAERTVWDFTCLQSYRTIFMASQSLQNGEIPFLGRTDTFLQTTPSEEDEEIMQWIKEMGIEPDFCERNIEFEQMNPYTIALWKGQRLVELGGTRYIENDAEQALVLSRYFPYIEILWWNNGAPIAVKSTAFSF